MRIIGGTWRGRILEAPPGRDPVRPTTDRNREAMISMVLSALDLDLSDASVLDAFAGSGAIGLECASRGAARVTLVERDRFVVKLLGRNIHACGAEHVARVVPGDIFRLARQGHLVGGPFSLLVLDPPYAYGSERMAGLIRTLEESSQLVPGALVLYEHASSDPGLALTATQLGCTGMVVSTRTHGTTTIDLIRLGVAHDIARN